MITTRDDYLDLLYNKQNPNRKYQAIPGQGHLIVKYVPIKYLNQDEFMQDVRKKYILQKDTYVETLVFIDHQTQYYITEPDPDTFNQGTYYYLDNGKYIEAKHYDPDTLYFNEPIYSIDLDSRKINAPKFLSVEYDHNAETIYFEVDRFYDNIDLATMFCVIQYQNANPNKLKNGYIYPVPYFDTISNAENNKIRFQWAIEGPATAYSGKVTFSIKFYKISSLTIDSADGHSTELKVYDYVLNTQPATSEVLHGLDVLATSENYYFEASEVEKIYQTIEEVRRTNDLYWIVLEEESIPISPADYPDKTINKNNIITDLITE